MRENRPVKICPICHKAFTIKEGQQTIGITCSVRCGTLWVQHDRHSRQRLVDLAAELKRPPRTDCRCYMEGGWCSGLNSLWCKYEECKFYKPRED